MSIYATYLALDGDGEHADGCTAYREARRNYFELTGKPCDCSERFRQPLVYEGSHVLPSDGDRRGGHVELATIPSHITRDGRGDAPDDGAPKRWLRLGVASVDSTEQYRGRPYIAGGHSIVVLTRQHATELYAALGDWLEQLN